MAAIAAALLWISCAEEGDNDVGTPRTLVIWDFGGVPGHEAWIRGAVDSLDAARDDLHIKLETRDWATQRESLISSTVVGEGADIVRVHHKYAVEFGELGGLLALDNFADFPQVRSKLLDNLWDHVAYDGQHYGVPVSMLPFIMPVNRHMLQAHGLDVPATWEDMWDMGPALKASGIHTLTMPAGLNLDTAYRFLALFYRAGGRLFNDDWTAAAFNGPAGLGTLKFLIRMKDAGFFPAASTAYRSDENEAHWSTEKAALAIEGPWWQSVAADHFGFDLAKLQLAQVPRPQRLLEDNESKTLIDVVMVAITGYTKAPDAAWEVVKALAVEDPVWHRPDPSMGGMSTHKVAYGPGVASDYMDLPVLAEAGANGLGWPGHPAITEIQRHLADAVNMALTGTMDPQQALDHAAAEVNEILADY